MESQVSSIKRSAFVFIVIMGVVSLLSDLTHEGARSIYGVYLNGLGASAAAIGFVAGAGQFLGHTLRLVTGIWVDKYKKYWLMTIVGYGMNLIAIPTLALVGENGWLAACALLMLERVGKAIRQPAKNTLVSFAAHQVGAGKAFAIQEALDQLGAFLGPVLLFGVLWWNRYCHQPPDYRLCFAILGIPALLTLICVWIASRRYPAPEAFETPRAEEESRQLPRAFWWYLGGSACVAFGFIDFPLITMHVGRMKLCNPDILPLLYAAAMLVDAVAALVFGWWFDQKGLGVLRWAVVLSAAFPIFAFSGSSMTMIWLGAILWGVGMGAQESILKSAVTVMVAKNRRATAFGVFGTVFGIAWFLGSWLLGFLYEFSLTGMIVVSIAIQLAACFLFPNHKPAAPAA